MTAYKNTVNKLKRRNIQELQGLSMSVIEQSFEIKLVNNKGIRCIKPLKKYNKKAKLLLKHNNKNKY